MMKKASSELPLITSHQDETSSLTSGGSVHDEASSGLSTVMAGRSLTSTQQQQVLENQISSILKAINNPEQLSPPSPRRHVYISELPPPSKSETSSSNKTAQISSQLKKFLTSPKTTTTGQSNSSKQRPKKSPASSKTTVVRKPSKSPSSNDENQVCQNIINRFFLN
jgi:hypothetical protein